MFFNFIDKITYFESGKKACGIKKITESQKTFLNQGEIYPMFLIEAIGQLNAWITMEINDFQVRPIAILYGEINLYSSAKIGDILEIETTLTRLDGNSSLFNGTVKLNNNLLVEVIDAAGSFLDIQDFAHKESYIDQFNALQKDGLKDFNNPEAISNLMEQDTILEKTETKITAKKAFNEKHLFFQEHFPKKPVLPISILLQNCIELAKVLVNRNNNFKKIQLQRIKMREFVVPNLPVLTEVNIVEDNNSTITCRLDVKTEEKNICRGMVIFFLE